MSRIEALCIKALTSCGLDPTAGDLAAGGIPRWPESQGGSSEPVAPVPALGSPYECTPTTWGVEEAPVPKPSAASDRQPSTASDRQPAAASDRQPAAASDNRESPRRRRRWDLELRPQPVPRGLLLS